MIRIHNPFLSLSHLLVVLFFFGIGGFFLLVSSSNLTATDLVYFLEIYRQQLFYWGACFLFIGVIFLLGFHAVHRQVYLQLKMNPLKVSIDPSLLKDVLLQQLQSKFKRLSLDVLVHPNQTLEITASFDPPISLEKSLKEVEVEIQHILHKEFHYSKNFIFTFIN